MKDLHADTLTHLALPTTTLAEAWRVIRADGETLGFTSHDVAVTIDGVLYRAAPGLRATAAHSDDQLSVDTLDVSIFLDASTEAEVAAGVWDNAQVTVFEYNWADPPATFDTHLLILRHGFLGELRRQGQGLTAEISGLARVLKRRIGRQYMPTCPWRHAQWDAEAEAWVSSTECGLSLAGLVHTGTVTTLGTDPTREFSDTASTRVDHYYAQGFLHFTSGDNAGVTREVASWISDAFLLYRPLPYAAQVGDAYTAIRGDDHTWETCRDTFANHLNSGGFPHLPGIAAVWGNPTGA